MPFLALHESIGSFDVGIKFAEILVPGFEVAFLDRTSAANEKPLKQKVPLADLPSSAYAISLWRPKVKVQLTILGERQSLSYVFLRLATITATIELTYSRTQTVQKPNPMTPRRRLASRFFRG